MLKEEIKRNFEQALDDVIQIVREDRSILAAILRGSLSHDTVWSGSDIDLILVTIDDRKVGRSNFALYSGGVNIHANLMPRAEFRKLVEGSIHNSFMHSMLAKGKLIYTHDETIADLLAGLHRLGERDARLQLLRAGISAVLPLYKAHKWLVTRGDLNYAGLWILYSATPLAQIEVISAGRLVDREVILQALKLNPETFEKIYTDLLNSRKTKRSVQAALDAADDFLAGHARNVFAPVIDHLEEIGETRGTTEIEDHFTRNFDVHGVTVACEYLSDQGLIGKASTTAFLTRKSTAAVQELAFFHTGLAGPDPVRRRRQ